MTPPKSYWRQTPASENFAELETSQGHRHESPGIGAPSSSLNQTEQKSISRMTRTRSSSTKSRRSSTVDAEFEEDDLHESSDEDSKKKSRKSSKMMDHADRLVVSAKRRDQNRVSQRAFRQRKERHTKELETHVEELESLLENLTHENNIVHSQMGRMEEELCYYRRLLFAGASQNRVAFSPVSSGSSTALSFTSSQFKGSGFDSSAPQTSGFATTPYLAPYHSFLDTTSGHAPLPAEAGDTSFGILRFSVASNNSCSTGDHTPARSCSPDSPNPFLPRRSSPNSVVLTSPIPSHPAIGNFNINEDRGLWGLDTSGWGVNNNPTLFATTRDPDVPDHAQYLPPSLASWND